MDLRQMRYFVALADERNFTRAADRLHIAQPPLSRQIQHLEVEVGADLIDRSERPLKLTAAGNLFYQQAVQILGRVDDMKSMMSRAAASERRQFTIGFVASTIYARLPALIRGFRKAAPHVHLNLVEMVSLDQISALKEGRIDLGFGRIRFEDEDVRRTVLREERLVVALPSEHPLSASTRSLSLAQIATEPLILYPSMPRPSYADQVVGLFLDQGLNPRISREARELQIAIGLVAAEEGICIVPESVQKSRIDDVCYRALTDPATSPIIMSQRRGDTSLEIGIMGNLIIQMYSAWGYPISEGLRQYAEAKDE